MIIKLLITESFNISVTKDLTGFELPSLPAPKIENEVDKSGVTKPDLKELFSSLTDYVKEKLEYVKKITFNEKNVSLKIQN